MAKILVIDDEEQQRELLKKILNRGGHEVITAVNGRDGIERFSQILPALVITDIFMPDKNGIDVITELLSINKDLAIIAVSGTDMRQLDALDEAILLGVKGVLEKPFTHKQLFQIVEQALS